MLWIPVVRRGSWRVGPHTGTTGGARFFRGLTERLPRLPPRSATIREQIGAFCTNRGETFNTAGERALAFPTKPVYVHCRWRGGAAPERCQRALRLERLAFSPSGHTVRDVDFFGGMWPTLIIIALVALVTGALIALFFAVAGTETPNLLSSSQATNTPTPGKPEVPGEKPEAHEERPRPRRRVFRRRWSRPEGAGWLVAVSALSVLLAYLIVAHT